MSKTKTIVIMSIALALQLGVITGCANGYKFRTDTELESPPPSVQGNRTLIAMEANHG